MQGQILGVRMMCYSNFITLYCCSTLIVMLIRWRRKCGPSLCRILYALSVSILCCDCWGGGTGLHKTFPCTTARAWVTRGIERLCLQSIFFDRDYCVVPYICSIGLSDIVIFVTKGTTITYLSVAWWNSNINKGSPNWGYRIIFLSFIE
jgi:hypothetical protein